MLKEHEHYNALVTEILEHGNLVNSRHGPTRELIGHSYDVYDLALPYRKNMRLALAVAESLQIVAGVFDPDILRMAAPNAQHHLFTEQMAYGPRLRTPMRRIIKTLERDPDSRQAVALLNVPRQAGTNDLTCTLGIQFLSRSDRLDVAVFMRSWDMVKGAPYDLYAFQLIKALVARCLGLKPGWLHVLASSVHVYEADVSRALGMNTYHIRLMDSVPSTWSEVTMWARRILAGYLDGTRLLPFMTSEEE